MGKLTDVGAVEGKSFPLGATHRADGVNFSVYSKNATAVELLLFHSADDSQPARTISLDPAKSRTYFYWHVFVPGLQAGQITVTASPGPTIQEKAFVSIPARYFSIHTGRVW